MSSSTILSPEASERRKLARRWAIGVSAGTFLISLFVLTAGQLTVSSDPAPRATTSTSVVQMQTPAPVETTHVVVVPDTGSSDAGSETTTTTTGTDARTEQTTTVIAQGTPDGSVVGRAFANPTMPLALMLVIALALAFLAGLVTQRVLLGEFGIKVANLFEVAPLEGVDAEEVEKIDVISVSEVDKRSAQQLRAYRLDLPPVPVVVSDARLRLIGLRVSLEIALRRAALRWGLESVSPLSVIITTLVADSRLTQPDGERISSLIGFGDRIAQGALVDGNAVPLLQRRLERAIVKVNALEPRG